MTGLAPGQASGEAAGCSHTWSSLTGSAIATPLVQLGTLISVIAFILASEPWLGVLALGVVLPQAAVVFVIQSRINQRVGERVQTLRDASDRISESDLAGVEDEVVEDFQDVFETRRRLFLLKLPSKFALSAISVTGAVGFCFSAADWFWTANRRRDGRRQPTGLTRIERPWRELVSFFRSASTVRVKYAMLVGSIVPRLAAAR